MITRLTVGARLMAILGLLAAFSIAIALLLQDRALSADLERSAEERLERASEAASLLLAQHLGRMGERYTAISHTPEFRANLRTQNAPTLTYYARLLVQDQRADAIVFLDRAGRQVARAGEAELAEAAAGVIASPVLGPVPEGADGPRHCVSPSAERGTAGLPAFSTCVYPVDRVQGTLLGIHGVPYGVSAVPLFEGTERLGTLVAAELVSQTTIEAWSVLCGAAIATAEADDPAQVVFHRTPELALSATLSFSIEREALAHARQNLFVAGAIAVIAAMGASVLLSRHFVHPIRQIVAATERVGLGDLASSVPATRGDELGDVARAFNATVGRLRRSQARVEVAQRLAKFSDWDLDVEAGLVEGSAEFARIFSLGAAGPVPLQALLDRIHVDDRESLRSLLATCGDEGRPFRVDVRARGDEARILHMQGQRVLEGGRSGRVQASVQDVTQRKHFEEQIRLLAYHDSLTGIGNRRYFAQQLDQRLAAAEQDGEGLSLLFIDLDRFKNINDTMGHTAGDELLQVTSARIVATIGRAEGVPRDQVTVARLGGDEFTVLLPGIVDEKTIGGLAEDLLSSLAAPCSIQGHGVVVTGSIGISVCPRDGSAAEDLVRSSDTAMYHAKGDGRNGYRFYEASMQADAMERWRLENRLRRAIEREELRVHYQPRCRVDSGRVSQVEALLRWRDPELGAVSPDDFIAIAEESGLICALGSWVLQQSLEQVAAWREAGWEIGVSINLSSHQLQPGLLLEVREHLERTGVDPAWVEFEVTESALLVDERVAIDVLSGLRAAGSRISLDDFGTGYSSLSHLSRLPVDALKIDRSFIEPITEDPDAAGLVAAIVATAKVLRLDVVAEGVETEGQRELLEEMGCDEMQGFLFGHAVSPEAVAALLEEEKEQTPDARPAKRKKRTGRKKKA